MKMMRELRNGIYQTKADRLIYFERLYKLLDECSNLGVFENVKDVSSSDWELEKNVLYGFKETGAVVNGIAMKETYYLFYGNTCIVYNRNGRDEILRVKVKEPNGRWWLDISNYCEYDDLRHVHFQNKCIDVYCRWDVDWMGFGERDDNSVAKPGSWWKYVYDDICGMYEAVAKKSVDYMFNEEYKKANSSSENAVVDETVKVTTK